VTSDRNVSAKKKQLPGPVKKAKAYGDVVLVILTYRWTAADFWMFHYGPFSAFERSLPLRMCRNSEFRPAVW